MTDVALIYEDISAEKPGLGVLRKVIIHETIIFLFEEAKVWHKHLHVDECDNNARRVFPVRNIRRTANITRTASIRYDWTDNIDFFKPHINTNESESSPHENKKRGKFPNQ